MESIRITPYYLFKFITACLFVSLFVLPAKVSAQSQNSRAGDEAALNDIYTSLDGPNWDTQKTITRKEGGTYPQTFTNTGDNTGWSSNVSLDDAANGGMYGVEVAEIDGELRVTRLDLYMNNLEGVLPESITNLSKATYINIKQNIITGSLPSNMSNLTNITDLYLQGTITKEHPKASPDYPLYPGKQDESSNNFSGEIPSNFFNMPTLEYFQLSARNLTGTIPASIGNATAVKKFNMTKMYGMSGTIPDELGYLSNCTVIHISGNFTGPLPGTTLSGMTSMRKLSIGLYGGNFGNFPDISGMTQLREIVMPTVHADGAWTGPFPDYLFDGTMPDLINIFIYPGAWDAGESVPVENASFNPDLFTLQISLGTVWGEGLTGEFPWLQLFETNQNMENFDIRWNNFGGEIPPFRFTGNGSLRNFMIGSNNFTGPWPEQDWTGDLNDFTRASFGNNRFVFSDMLYLSDGKPVFQWYAEEAELSFDYQNQKPFGASASVTVAEGDTVTLNQFETVVTHADNNYQWQKDGVDIAGATAQTLTISGAGTSDAGTYRLKVTNSLFSSLVSSLGLSDMILTSQPVTLQIGETSNDTSPPQVPALISPDDGATGTSTGPTLDWSASSGANSYNVQLAAESDFSLESLVAEATGLTATEYAASGLDYKTVYYWRVQAVNEYGSSDWSTANSFETAVQPPAKPSLLSPANGATSQPVDPTLDWEAADRADSYNVLVSANESFSEVVVDMEGVSDGTSLQAEGLDNATTYWWKVRAVNNSGYTESETRSFSTVEAALEQPQLVDPADGATDLPTTLTLSWNSVDGANSYRMQLATNNTFESPVTDEDGITAIDYTVENLENGQTYYWRVRAANSNGSSSWSVVRNFSTEAGENTSNISAPVQRSPNDGAAGTSLSPNFDWDPVNGADYYILHVSGIDPAEMVIEEEVNETTFSPVDKLVADRTHHWRVRAVKDGIEGEWSQTWEFTTGSSGNNNTLPEAPSLVAPANGSSEISVNPTMEWNKVDGPVSYRLQIYEDESFSNVIIDRNNLTAAVEQVSGLSNSTTYFWRVRAVQDGSEGEWSSIWSFTTGSEEQMETTLTQNYPNPFNPSTQVRFTLGETQQVSLKVYDTVGREVATIVEGRLTAGSYERTFRADNLASGVYFLRFITENRILTSQMTLMK